MAKKRKREDRVELRLGDHDRAQLEIISEVHGVSLSGAIRAAIRAMAEQLGLTGRKEK